MEGKRYTVHLAGPLSGCNERQRRLWRDEFKKYCPDFGTIDPSEWGDEWDFSRDLRAVAACDVVVANMWKESIGTTLEIMHARSRGKPVVLVDPNHLEHAILRGLVAPEKPVHTVKEAAARVRRLVSEMGVFNVQKKDGVLEPFDRDKLMRAIKLACAEAGVDDLEFPNQIIGLVVGKLRQAAESRVITTDDVRKGVFAALDTLAEAAVDRKTVGESAGRVKRAWVRREQYKEGDAFFAGLADANAALRAQVDQLETLVAELQHEIAERDARLTEMERSPAPAPVLPPETLLAALQRVEREYADALAVHPRAVKSAKESPFQDIAKAHTALLLLARYARERLEAATTPCARPVGAREWFKQHQEEAPWLDYAAHESRTTKTMWADERTIEHEGETLLIEQHLRVGRGSARDLLRIHFAVHQGSGQVVVGHCGKHLRNTKT